MNGTDKIPLEYCLDQNNRVKHLRSVQGDSCGVHINPKLQEQCVDALRIDGLHVSCWIFLGLQVHTRRRTSRRRNRRTRRKTNLFFTAVNPRSTSFLTLREEEGKPCMIPCMIFCILKWKRVHTAIHCFDLELAQDKRLVCWQTHAKALTKFYGSMFPDYLGRRSRVDIAAEILCQKNALQAGTPN